MHLQNQIEVSKFVLQSLLQRLEGGGKFRLTVCQIAQLRQGRGMDWMALS